MSAYLLGFVVADYTCTSKRSNRVIHRVCGTPTDTNNGNGQFALNTSIEFLEYYTKFYGQDYPLSKGVCHGYRVGDLGIALGGYVAKLPGGSNHGNHSFRFGNLVTMKWWNDVWLNEGFATFAQGEGSADTTILSDNPTKKSSGYENYLFKEHQMKAFGRDAYISSRPASVNITDMSSFHYLFDEIAYQKGASLLQQRKLIMDPDLGDNRNTEGSLQKGVSEYLKNMKYGNAEQSELWGILDSVYSTRTPGVTSENVMNTWTLQMNFPVVMVSKVSETELLLVQKRFVYMNGDGEGSPDSPYQYQWYVPVKGKICTIVADDGGGTKCMTKGTDLQWIRPFHTLEMIIADDNGRIKDTDSVFINYNAQGYYFTVYSKELWDSLISNFAKMDLNSREQQLLLFETAQLVKAGYYEESRFGDILDAVVAKATDDSRLISFMGRTTLYQRLTTWLFLRSRQGVCHGYRVGDLGIALGGYVAKLPGGSNHGNHSFRFSNHGNHSFRFGNLVTMKWWNDVWLNEGFATFAQGEGSADTTILSDNPINKSSGYENYLFKEHQMKAFGRDAYLSSRPASVNITDMSSFHYLFDEIAYQKGASLLQQLKLIMDPDLGDNRNTDGSLQKGISEYLKNKKYGNAEQSELWGILDSVYSTRTPGVTIENVMNTWTLQMNFPVVMVSKVSETELLLVQKRFVYMNGDGEGSPDSPYQYQWYVPVKGKVCNIVADGAGTKCITDGTKLQWIRPFHTLKMTIDNGSIKDTDSVFINYNAQGYYFTVYSKELWDSLISNFAKMDLNSREQQLLLFETAQLVKAGYYEESRFEEILDAVVSKATKDFRLMSTVLNHIKSIHSDGGDISTKYEDYVKSFIMANLTSEIDSDAAYSAVESNLVAMDMCLTIAPEVEIEVDTGSMECREVIKELNITKYPDFTTPYYMAHLYNESMYTNVTDWKKVWDMYTDPATSDSNKATLGSILAQTNEETLVDKFIAATRNPDEIKKTNGPLVLSRTIAPVRSEHLAKVVDDMIKNWDEIYKCFGEQVLSLSSYIQGVVGMVTDQATLDKIVEEFGDCSKWPALQSSYQSGLQKALTTISYA
eukprot:sb/3461420/